MEKKIKELKPDFTLLITGSTDNDLAAENAAKGLFTVHHKLSYVCPFEKFSELRRLQLKLRNSPAAMGKRVCAAVDLGEWTGHENEEYFTASVKFFHDMTDRMNFIFTVGDKSEKEVIGIRKKLRLYMRGETVVDKTFTDKSRLADYIWSRVVRTDTAELIAEMLMMDEMKELRSYPAVNRLCYEMRASSASGIVTSVDMQIYLTDKDSLPYITDSEIAEEYAERAARLTEKTVGKESIVA